MSAERAHTTTLRLLSTCPQLVRLAAPHIEAPASLHQQIWGLSFPHPVGLAAGLDKNAEAIPGWFACGFSFAEVGTVTPMPQPGNPQPRLFRLREDQALINRMGFNNHGVTEMRKHLAQRRPGYVVGVNLGKNKWTPNESAVDDYVTLITHVGTLADYFVINVSSPNTPGLRDLQSEEALIPLVQTILERRDELGSRPPVLVKLSPDLPDSALTDLAKALMTCGVDGFIATNTTIARNELCSPNAGESGGLSGRPLAQRSTDVIRLLHQATQGTVPIIGCGGIFSAQDAYQKIRAGAHLVQVYTGFIYRGPRIVKDIVDGLDELLRQDGYAHVRDAIGVDA
jgi:dihydroorotate dehydrogenase